jgi:hypothetical protein
VTPTLALPPPLLLLHAMLPLKPTAGTTGRAGKDGYGVALVHSSCGGRLGRGEELSWRGELDGGGGGHICVGGRPSAATWVDSLDLPPPPHPYRWGPRSRAQAMSSLVASGRSTPWAVEWSCRQAALGVPSAGAVVACGGSTPP